MCPFIKGGCPFFYLVLYNSQSVYVLLLMAVKKRSKQDCRNILWSNWILLFFFLKHWFLHLCSQNILSYMLAYVNNITGYLLSQGVGGVTVMCSCAHCTCQVASHISIYVWAPPPSSCCLKCGTSHGFLPIWRTSKWPPLLARDLQVSSFQGQP